MTSITPDRSPQLFDGRPILELIVPVVLEDIQEPYEHGLVVAAGLAQSWQVPVRIVHVEDHAKTHATTIDQVKQAFRGMHPELLVDAVEVEADDVAAAITEVATEQSLILLASERATQWLEAESVGEAVVQAADKMLLLCGPHCEQPPTESSVVVPLDGSPRAEEALAPAMAIAHRWGSRLWLVTAVAESTSEMVAALRAEGQEVSESAYVRGVAERLAETSEVDVGWQMIHDDDPVAAVSAFADEQGSSMIVAATHGETGVARRLFGSICMGLVERAAVPVLIVKTAMMDEPALTSADA